MSKRTRVVYAPYRGMSEGDGDIESAYQAIKDAPATKLDGASTLHYVSNDGMVGRLRLGHVRGEIDLDLWYQDIDAGLSPIHITSTGAISPIPDEMGTVADIYHQLLIASAQIQRETS